MRAESGRRDDTLVSLSCCPASPSSSFYPHPPHFTTPFHSSVGLLVYPAQVRMPIWFYAFVGYRVAATLLTGDRPGGLPLIGWVDSPVSGNCVYSRPRNTHPSRVPLRLGCHSPPAWFLPVMSSETEKDGAGMMGSARCTNTRISSGRVGPSWMRFVGYKRF